MPAQPQRQWILKEKLDVNSGTLPQNSVLDMYFDNSTGFLWVATEAGLVRYNGKTAATFDSRNLPGIKSPRIKKFMRSVNGKVYVFTLSEDHFAIDKDIPASAGISYYSQLTDFGISFSNYNSDDGNLLDLQPSAKAYLHMEYMPKGSSQTFWLNKTDYIASNLKGFYHINNKEIINEYTESGLGPAAFFVLNDRLYSRSASGTVYQLSINPWQVKKIETDPVVRSASSYFFPNTVLGTPFILSGDSLFSISSVAGKIYATLFAVLPVKVPDISCVTINPYNGQVYCGSITSGLYIFSRSNFYTYTISPEYITRKKLASPNTHWGFNNIYSTIVLQDSLYALTNEGILFDLRNGSFTYPVKYPGVNLNRFYNYQVDSRTYIWGYGTNVTYMTRNVNSDRFSHSLLKGKSDRYWLSKAADGTIWALGTDELGLFKGDSIHKISNLSWLPDSIKNQLDLSATTGTIIGPLDKKKLLLFHGYSLYTLDTNNFSFKKIASLPEHTYRAFIPEGDRYYWISTYGNGIFLYDIKENKLYPGPLDIRRLLLYAHTFAADNKGHFLIPTNKGLFRINKQHLLDLCLHPGGELLYEYFDTKNGLTGIEFNGGCIPSFNKLPGGDILFPSISGLVRTYNSGFQPGKKYPLFIDQVKSSRTVYSFKEGMPFAANERTQYWQLNFAQWTDLYSGHIFYRLDNSAWLPAESPANLITLTELSGGRHTLEVKVLFDLDQQEISLSAFHFSVGKRYYEKSWFWILLILALLGITTLASYIRNYQIKQKNILLKNKVHEKTEQLEEKTALLEEKNTTLEETLAELNSMMADIKEKNEFQKKMIRIIGHDVMVPLQYIAKTTKQLSLYKDTISPELRDETTQEINNTSTGLMYLGQSIIQWIKLQENSFRIDASEFDVLKSLQQLIPLHTRLLHAKNNVLDIQISPGLVFNYDPVALRIIIHNLVMNANKFTANGTITVKCDIATGWMLIEVTDTGVGMEPEVVESLNHFKAVGSVMGTDSEGGWGLGYKVIFDLVKASQGTLEIISSQGKGTSVKIALHE